MVRFVVALVVGLVALSATSPANAYCRKTTTSDASETADPARAGQCDAPVSSALPLYWAKSCVEYRIVVDPALEASGKMTAARAADIVHRSSATWAGARCPGANGETQPVSIHTADIAEGGCAGAHGGVHNEVRFTSEPPDGDTLAVTDVAFDAGSGGVLTAVTRVFDVYSDLGKTPAEVDPHVEYVVRHELGHFLGLAHSEQSEAIMSARFQTRPNDALTDDDVRGICEIYSPDAPIGAGCSVGGNSGAPGNRVVIALAALGCLAVAARRRMRTVASLVVATAVVMTCSTSALAAPQAPHSAKTKTKNATKSATAKPTRAPKRTASPASPATTAPSEATDEELTRGVLELSSPAPAPVMPPVAVASMQEPDVTPPAHEPDVVPPAPRAPRTSEVHLGGAYRAFVLPRAMIGVLGRANTDPFFQSVSAEASFRSGKGFAIVPALTFADLSTGDMLVGSHSADRASSFSYVRSDLKALAASAQLVWSLPVSHRVELELGVELGVGVTFGPLVNDWVHETPDGPLALGGRRFAECRTVNDGVGCRPQDHGSPNPVRVGGHREAGLFDGGSAPTVLPWVSLPLVGVRTRIGDDVALRVGIGASATGLWAGASLGYAVARADARATP